MPWRYQEPRTFLKAARLKLAGLRTALFAAHFLLWALAASAAPFHVCLTWQGDPSKTMTVNFQTKETTAGSTVYFDTKSRGGIAKDYRHLAKGEKRQIPGLTDERAIHTVELTRLKSSTIYYFIAGDPENGFSIERKFRTIPDGREPIRFIEGGDMSTGPRERTLLQVAAKQDPMFGLIGGDIPYANGKIENFGLWDIWLNNWEELMVTSDGLTIPMVLAIGNHEVNNSKGTPRERAPFFFDYFAQENDRPYFSRQFGSDTIIYVLDTNHLTPHGGAQSQWLAAEMEKYKKVRNRFAVYHVPLYPSYRRYEDSPSALGRENWGPIFDKYALTAAFENHDHTLKRSKPLKNNQVDPKGTLYLGDGCFGQGPRKVSDEPRWYLEKSASVAHFWRVDVTKKGINFTAIDEKGAIVDTCTAALN